MKSKSPSMQDIADRLGISKNAVSLALGHKPGVSESLRAQIFETAQLLHYRTFTKKGKLQPSILVMIPEYIRYDRFFYYDIYWAIEKRAQENGYKAILCNVTQEMEALHAIPEIYQEIGCDGLLLVGVFQETYVRTLLQLGCPLVTVDHDYDDLKLNAVVTANEAEAYRIVSYLIGQGHRDIGFIGAIGMTRSFMERWNGFRLAMQEANLTIDAAHCITGEAPLPTLHSVPNELRSHVEQLETQPTAWFCANDRIAMNLIQILSARGFKVPEDISVAGFDDIEAASMIYPPLTTVQVQREQLGFEAVDFLIRKIDYGGSPMKIAVYGELIERDSCTAPRSER